MLKVLICVKYSATTGTDIVGLSLISNDATALGQQTVTFSCVGFGAPAVLTSWSLNGVTLQNSSLITIYETQTVQQGRVYSLSLLELCSVGAYENGDYSCTASNGFSSANSITQLNVLG